MIKYLLKGIMYLGGLIGLIYGYYQIGFNTGHSRACKALTTIEDD